MSKVVRIVVADDSPFIRSIICSHLMRADGFDIVGTAEDGHEAVKLVRKCRPDVVTMDVDMPGMDGMEALEEIMRDTPTPVVMVSGVSIRAADTTMNAIKTGAVDFVLKYIPGEAVNPETFRLDMISKVRAASEVAVVRTIPNRLGSFQTPDIKPVVQRQTNTINDLVIVGASTGGPIAIKELLKHLPKDFAAPIVIVQHIPKPFTDVLATQLASQLPYEFNVVEGGETLRPHQVYIAPGDKHLLLNTSMKFEVQDGPAICGHRPSIDVAMMSVAQSFPNQIYGVLLSGMGSDGASGLSFIKARGGRTFAQSSETCVVDGMTSKAISNGAVNHVASPQGISERLTLEIDRAISIRKSAMSTGSFEPDYLEPFLSGLNVNR